MRILRLRKNHLSVIRQKAESQTYVRELGGKKYSFFRKFAVFCFLGTPVLRFAFLPYCHKVSNATNGHLLSKCNYGQNFKLADGDIFGDLCTFEIWKWSTEL